MPVKFKNNFLNLKYPLDICNVLFLGSFSWKNEKLVNLVNFQDDQSALNPSLDVHSGLRPLHSSALNKSSSYIHDHTEYRMEGRSLEHCDVLQYSAIESTKGL